MDTIKKCFEIILKCNQTDSRLAARRVRNLVYGAQGGRDKYDDIKNIINDAFEKYVAISEEWRQENFVMAVSVIYFLHDKEECPDFLFPWLFQLLQHQNGYIRHAAVRMFETAIGPLTVHLRCPEYRQNKLKSEKSDKILHALYKSLHGLMSFIWEPEYKKFKYIDSLPACPYKSIQMVLAELEDSCGKEYLDRIS